MELKRFFYFSFFAGSYRGLNIEKIEWIPVRFYSHFPEILTKTLPILLKFDNFVETVVDFYLQRQKTL